MIFPGEQKQLGEQNFVNTNFQMRNAGTKKAEGNFFRSNKDLKSHNI